MALRPVLLLLSALRQAGEDAGMRQVDLADALGWPQSAVGKFESGERRLDLLELEDVCRATGITLMDFVRLYEAAADAVPGRARGSR